LVSNRAKLRLLREPWVRAMANNSDESLVAFLQRRLGSEAGRLGATLMAHGVFAGDPERLSARAAFPALVALGDETGSVVRGGLAKRRARQQSKSRARVHVATNGMASLAGELAEYLGDGFRSNWAVDTIRRRGESWVVKGVGEETAPAVVVALAPAAAARLAPQPLMALLGEPVAAPVAVVGLGGSSADLPLPLGFGALIGPDSDVRALGLLFESSYAPGRAADSRRLLKCIYGGAADPEVLELNDEQLVKLTIEEVGRVVGVVPQPTWTRVIRHAPGIPQYNLGHLAWLERLDEAMTGFPGFHLAGWGYRGIGVTSLAQDATRVADKVMGS
ncbi:MAG: protoporphyrinogen oxidase, partial [Acidimicrobiales bacterium]